MPASAGAASASAPANTPKKSFAPVLSTASVTRWPLSAKKSASDRKTPLPWIAGGDTVYAARKAATFLPPSFSLSYRFGFPGGSRSVCAARSQVAPSSLRLAETAASRLLSPSGSISR